LTTVRDADHFDALLADSHEQPVLLFKHSQSCGASFEALDQILAHRAEAASAPGLRYAMLTVQRDPALSKAVAARLGVRHETPQVILVRNGRAVWTASHFRISAAALDKAIGTM
jgi:bacillithiol system protein YtxJ